MKISNLMRLLIILMLLALILPFSTACREGVDNSIVQIWKPSAESGEPETLLAFGTVVDDGNYVLTVLDYEEYTPSELLVVSPKYGQFKASVQAVDYRTSATLLKLQDADLPVAEIGDSLPLESKQQVFARGWGGPNDEYMKTPLEAYRTENISPLFFSVSIMLQEVLDAGKGSVGEPGAAITDKNGKVIGLIGNYWNKLVLRLGGPGDHYPPYAVSIDSALELLDDPSHINGPVVAIFINESSADDTIPGSRPRLPINVIEGLDFTVIGLLDKLGDPLPIDDLSEYRYELSVGFYTNYPPEEGNLLVVTFPYPLVLKRNSGNFLMEAKWVGIQWDRRDGEPNRLLYGSTNYTVEGAYSIESDLGNLIQILQPVLQKMS
ncbi:hypothetical protein ACFLYB_01500 [Chloroflexota bacterium]